MFGSNSKLGIKFFCKLKHATQDMTFQGKECAKFNERNIAVVMFFQCFKLGKN